jgi:hypothetical protein
MFNDRDRDPLKGLERQLEKEDPDTPPSAPTARRRRQQTTRRAGPDPE